MQTCDCTVRINGRMDFSIPKKGITPPEVVILRVIHGGDAVIDIKLSEGSKHVQTNAAEIERLKRVYGEKVFLGAFPGAMPTLPQTFEAIEPEPEPEPVVEYFGDDKPPVSEPKMEAPIEAVQEDMPPAPAGEPMGEPSPPDPEVAEASEFAFDPELDGDDLPDDPILMADDEDGPALLPSEEEGS